MFLGDILIQRGCRISWIRSGLINFLVVYVSLIYRGMKTGDLLGLVNGLLKYVSVKGIWHMCIVLINELIYLLYVANFSRCRDHLIGWLYPSLVATFRLTDGSERIAKDNSVQGSVSNEPGNVHLQGR